MTVKQRMEHNLWGWRLQPEDISQSMPVIMRQINAESDMFFGLKHKANPEKETVRKDCWNMDENIFTEESLENLFESVKSFAFRWCIAKLNSMK